MAYPAELSIEYPEKISRGILLLKFFLGWAYVGIPHGIILTLYGIASSVVSFIIFFTILFTGKIPRGLFDFQVGFYRWSWRVSAYADFLCDKYPPFSGAEEA